MALAFLLHLYLIKTTTAFLTIHTSLLGSADIVDILIDMSNGSSPLNRQLNLTDGSSTRPNMDSTEPAVVIGSDEADDNEFVVEAIEDARINKRRLDPATGRHGLLQYKIR